MFLSSDKACRNHGDTQKTQNKLKVRWTLCNKMVWLKERWDEDKDILVEFTWDSIVYEFI